MQTTETKVACLFLCAGQSSRMGGANKLLMPFDETSVVAKSAEQVRKARFSETVAVTGFQSDLIASELQPFTGLKLIENLEYAVGMHNSIRKGLEALSSDADFFAVCLADQPLLTSDDYDFLIQAASQFPNSKLIAPIYAGLRGNPTLISMKLRDEILRHADSDRGCSYLFEAYPDSITWIEMPRHTRHLDVDTKELLEEARKVFHADLN